MESDAGHTGRKLSGLNSPVEIWTAFAVSSMVVESNVVITAVASGMDRLTKDSLF